MLSNRHAKFVDEYMLDHNGSRAARAAGYAESGARVTAHRLLTDANIKAAIEFKSNNLARKYELDKHDVVDKLLEAIKLAENKQDVSSLIRGWSEIAKIMGFYNLKEVSTETGKHSQLKNKLAIMSDEELMAIIDK